MDGEVVVARRRQFRTPAASAAAVYSILQTAKLTGVKSTRPTSLTPSPGSGLNDVLIAIVDGLNGFPEAIATVFPLTTAQTCIIHLIRNSLAFVSWQDRKLIMPDLKAIYRAETAAAAGGLSLPLCRRTLWPDIKSPPRANVALGQCVPRNHFNRDVKPRRPVAPESGRFASVDPGRCAARARSPKTAERGGPRRPPPLPHKQPGAQLARRTSQPGAQASPGRGCFRGSLREHIGENFQSCVTPVTMSHIGGPSRPVFARSLDAGTILTPRHN